MRTISKDLRKQPRSPTRKRVRLGWTDASGNYCSILGHCTNISQDGMQLQIEHRIPMGSTVNFCLEPDGFRGSGSVRYCNTNGIKAALGIEFLGGLQWKEPRSRQEL